MKTRRPSQQSSPTKSLSGDEATAFETGDQAVDGAAEMPASPSATKLAERYFVVKSLTIQDLEQSVRTGIWATQSHNENSLNEAYQVSIFSC
jgi:hypothetical protein